MLLVLFKGNIAFSQPSISGAIITGLKNEETAKSENYNEVELKLETPNHKGVKGRFKVKFESGETFTSLERALIRYKDDSGLIIHYGLDELSFGLDADLAKKKRLAIAKNSVHESLQKIGISVPTTYLMASKKWDNVRYNLSLGSNESKDKTLIFNRKYGKHNDNLSHNLWLMYLKNKFAGTYFDVYGLATSIIFNSIGHKIIGELTAVGNVKLIEHAQVTDENPNTYFYGARIQYGYQFGSIERVLATPFLEIANTMEDSRKSGENTLHFLAGVKFRYADLEVNANSLIRSSRTENGNRGDGGQQVQLEARCYF